MSLVVNIIGAGKLGKTLGRLIVQNQLANLGGIYNRSVESRKEAIEFIGAGTAINELNLMPEADITLISTPDFQIENTSETLAQCQNVAGKIFYTAVIH